MPKLLYMLIYNYATTESVVGEFVNMGFYNEIKYNCLLLNTHSLPPAGGSR